jgi:hypothetical protein
MATIDKKMAAPPIPTNQWLQFIEDLLPYLTVFGLMWKAFDLVFKYFSDKQREAVKELIRTEVKPDIERLNGNFESLEKAIWALEKKIIS